MLICPKCASPEVRALPAFEGDRRAAHGLPREAARPRKRHTILWGMIASLFAALMLRDLQAAELRTFAFGVLTVGGALVAQRAHLFNSAEYPRRIDIWQRSKICMRCGAVVQDPIR